MTTQAPSAPTAAATRTDISRRLLAFGRPLLPVLALSTILRVSQMLLGIALFGVAAWGVGQVVEDPAAAPISDVVIVMVVIALLKGFLRYLEQFSGHYVAFHLLAMLRGYFYERLEPQAPAGVEGRRSGDLLSRVTKDIDRVEVFYAHTIAPAIAALVVPVCVLTFIALQFNLQLALALLPFLIIVGLVTPILSQRSAVGVATELRERRGDISQHLADSVQGVREVLAFGHVDRRAQELRALGEGAGAATTVMGRHIAVRRGANELAVALGVLAVLFVGRTQYLAGTLEWSELAVVVAISLLTFGPVLGVEEFVGDLEQAFASARRIWEVTDAPPAVADRVDVRDQPLDGQVEFVDVRFTYGVDDAPWAVDGVSASIPAGSKVAIVGASGSGKSTLVALLLRVWDPASGQVLLGGRDVRDIPLHQLREHVALVGQRTYLFNDTVAANLRIARPDASAPELEEACRQAALHDTITAMPDGYDTVIGEMGERLSGGQRQRLALARALLKDAPIIVLDEATSNLDVHTEAEIQHEIDAATRGRTVMVVAHRLSTITDADVIVVMEAGRIVERGTHHQLVAAHGAYSRLWQAQSGDLDELLVGPGADSVR